METIKKLLKKNIIFYPLLICLVGFCVYILLPLPNKFQQYQSLKNENQDKIVEKDQLTNDLNIVANENLRLDIARAQYKISNDGEIIFIFPNENDPKQK